MKIKLVNRMAGPDGNYAAGEIIEVDQKLAVELVGHGAAEYAEPEPDEDTAPEVETTTAEPTGETAMKDMTPKKKRTKSKRRAKREDD